MVDAGVPQESYLVCTLTNTGNSPVEVVALLAVAALASMLAEADLVVVVARS